MSHGTLYTNAMMGKWKGLCVLRIGLLRYGANHHWDSWAGAVWMELVAEDTEQYLKWHSWEVGNISGVSGRIVNHRISIVMSVIWLKRRQKKVQWILLSENIPQSKTLWVLLWHHKRKMPYLTLSQDSVKIQMRCKRCINYILTMWIRRRMEI